MASTSIHAIMLLFLMFFTIATTAQNTFNILHYGAKGDGKTDCSKAFLDAWDEACASDGTSTVVVPVGKFLTGPITFQGPCKAKMVFQTIGTILAIEDLSAYPQENWIAFEYLKGFEMIGGNFDGQGKSAWPKNNCTGKEKCAILPTSIQFSYVEDSTIEGITSINSKMSHIMIHNCTSIYLNKITISAPEDSPNTDGIHIGLSTNVEIKDANISTGDDCISIGPTNTGISISKVSCGPGHGISVAILGKESRENDVTNIYVKNCTLTETMYGVGVKTSPKSSVLTAKNFTFDDITMKNVGNPIIIDQEYCPQGGCAGILPPSKVKIADIRFKNVRGTSSTPIAISLKCSAAVPCHGVVLGNIYLEHSEGGATSECANVNGSSDGIVFPSSCI